MLKFKVNNPKSEELETKSTTSSSSRLSQISSYSSDTIKSEISTGSCLNSTERDFESAQSQHRTIISINDEDPIHNVSISKASTSNSYSVVNIQRVGVRNGIRLSTSLSSLSSIDSGEEIFDVVGSFK